LKGFHNLAEKMVFVEKMETEDNIDLVERMLIAEKLEIENSTTLVENLELAHTVLRGKKA